MATPKRARSTSEALDAGLAAVVGDIGKRVRQVPSSHGSDNGLFSCGSSSSDGVTDSKDASSGLPELVFRLHVIQQPQRARACGFGDKDHRPLSPIPIIQLRVYRRDDTEVPADQVDIATLVLCLDLWSADGTAERNIVRHIGVASSQLHSPQLQVAAAQKSSDSTERLRSLGLARSSVALSSTLSASSSAQLPRPHTTPMPSPLIFGTLSPTSKRAALSSSTATPSNATHPRWSSSRVTDSIRPVTAPSSSSHQTNLRSLPSLASITGDLSKRRSSSMQPGEYPASHPSTLSPIRANPRRESGNSSTTEYSQAPTDYSFFGHRASSSRPLSSNSTAYSSRMTDSRPQTATVPSPSGWGPSHAPPPAGFGDHQIAESSAAAALRARRPSSGYFAPGTPLSSIDEQVAPSAQPEDKANPPTSSAIAGVTQDRSEGSDDASSDSSDEAGSYSRVLVGLLAETCHKLTGMDGTTGLYFFPKTLGVRTEGRFAIKCTLVRFETPSLDGTDPSAVLCQVMTEPFEVFPAKRFPGVCALTDMTRHFSRQGIRLPVRRKFRYPDYEIEDDGNDDGQELYITEDANQGH